MSEAVARDSGEKRLARLAAEVERGEAHTVAVAFSDHYGSLRGRRLAATAFLGGPETAQGFCDGALVWDVRCEIFEATAFSNFRTGYPDCFARPDLTTLAPSAAVAGEYTVLCDVHSADGQAVGVDPRRVLRSVIARVPEEVSVRARLELRLLDDGLAASWAPGAPSPFVDRLGDGLRRADLGVGGIGWRRHSRTLALQFSPRQPLAAADALILARGAVREIAAEEGVKLTSMPRRRGGEAPLACRLAVAGAPTSPALPGRLRDLRLLLAPLPIFYPEAHADLAGAPGELVVDASSDCNPYLALAATLTAAFADAGPAAPSEGGGYEAAIERFAAAGWAADWLGPAFVLDTLALARREAGLRAAAITDWDFERYEDFG